ncbi:MAG: hypothetical protein AAF915_10825 [Cyanobacteria bacterium P01_D01_bin.50]
MGRYLTITIASILALAIAGCSSEEEQQTVEPTPSNTTTANKQGDKNKPFEDPVVPEKTNKTVAQAPSTLIQPINTTERLGIVSKGRADPFDEIVSPIIPATNQNRESTGINQNTKRSKKPVPVPPLPALRSSSRRNVSARRPKRSGVLPATTAPRPQRNVNKNSNSSRVSNRQIPKQTPEQADSNGGSAAPTPVVPKVMPGVIPQPDLASVLPPPPEPKLAQAVLVSGVIQVGSQPQAIIKVPSEPTSRYVQAGQRLASGLLVKRIEMNEGSEPVVILEQYGIEVARMVGEAPMGANQPATASTDNSVSTLPSPPKSVSIGAS